MKNPVTLPIPAMTALHKLGRDISHARRRRRIATKLMAERANISRTTLGKIEKGDPTASMGGYVAVLFALGMIDRVKELVDVSHDVVGHRLEAENLPQRIRLPKNKE